MDQGGIETVRSTVSRIGVLVTVLGVLGGVGALVVPPAALAAAQPNLSIVQRVSGSTQRGHVFVTFVIKNDGTASASHVNLELLVTTTSSSGFDEVFSGGSVTCEVMPAPPPYNYGTACQFSGTIAVGKTVSTKADYAGTPGAKVTTLAEVGEFQGDSNLKNNSISKTTYFGPRSDLAVSGTLKPGTKKGHATGVVKLANHGPNNAAHVQEVLEMKNVSTARATGNSGSCQIIPAASGYDLAASCVRGALDTAKVWKLTFDFHGTSGAKITVVTSVSSQIKDPNAANDTMTRQATLE